ncbi:MAG TPA: hypothetical protein PKK26_10755 [Candidatus Wallbacteria bacterium]|nr:hypothetical protein [Candidatus Wallbacteria bacterium]
MNSRSSKFIKEAVFAVLKGHLTVDGAVAKYGIPEEEIKDGIKNYCLGGKVAGEVESTFIGDIYKKFIRINARNAFSRIAPTYDQEKEIDRFKFKFAYATVSFMVVAFGILIMNFPGAYNPPDMNAQPFEDKMNQALLSSKRPSTIDAEVKYLNRFYSRINKILDSSNAKESQSLKAEINSRLAYINKIDQAEVSRKANNFNDSSAGVDRKQAAVMYKRMYSAASEKDENSYLAKAFKERADAENASGRSSVYIAKAESAEAVKSAPATVITASTQAEAEAQLAAAGELKPDIEEPAAEELKDEETPEIAEAQEPAANKTRTAKAAPAREEATVAKAESASAAKAPAEPAKSYRYAENKYDSMKDRLYIISKYKQENELKKVLVKQSIKFKYPVASMLPIVDKKKYKESFKRIATNPKDVGVKIVEDRG